jgi:hypothetical protein
MMHVIRPLLAPFVHKVLRTRFARNDARAIFDDAFDDYAQQRSPSGGSKQPALG